MRLVLFLKKRGKARAPDQKGKDLPIEMANDAQRCRNSRNEGHLIPAGTVQECRLGPPESVRR